MPIDPAHHAEMADAPISSNYPMLNIQSRRRFYGRAECRIQKRTIVGMNAIGIAVSIEGTIVFELEQLKHSLAADEFQRVSIQLPEADPRNALGILQQGIRSLQHLLLVLAFRPAVNIRLLHHLAEHLSRQDGLRRDEEGGDRIPASFSIAEPGFLC
nr:hypothetical protein [Sphingomonas sp. YR710]